MADPRMGFDAWYAESSKCDECENVATTEEGLCDDCEAVAHEEWARSRA